MCDEWKAIYSAAKERSPALAPGHLINTAHTVACIRAMSKAKDLRRAVADIILAPDADLNVLSGLLNAVFVLVR